MIRLLNYLTYSALILAVFSQSAFGLPAFPGAEGFGAETKGGRGGKVIAVSNLNDDGPGSLRAALTEEGPRIVVFRVAGNILLKSRIDVTEPYLTVAGQSAPGDGITISVTKDSEKGPLRISTHDVVLRYLRVRSGPTHEGSGESDAISLVDDAYNIVIDHCSFSWGTDEVFQTGAGAHDFTVQWSIIAEGLSDSTHPEGEHSKGLHFRGENSDNISVHHNLLAHNVDRNPNINTTGIFDMVNNVFYHASERWSEVKDKFGEPKVNAINNYYKLGPSGKTSKGYEAFYYDSTGGDPKIFVRGNIGFHRPTNDLPEELIVEEDSRFMIVDSRFPAPPVTTVSAFEAFDLVLENAGATLPARDAHDQRIVNDARNGTGKIIDAPSEVGGLLKLASGTAPVDTDGDGMPDKWEEQHGLNPNDAADGKQDRDGDGYTNVEEYLNSLVASDLITAVTTPLLAPLLPEEEDITPPTVSVSDPKDESTVSGTVAVSAVATDAESGIAGVQFKLDGNDLGEEVVAAPFSVLWDTTSETSGSYLLSALARDKAGNEAESSPVWVVVDPTAPPIVPSSDTSSNTIYVSTQSGGTITNSSQCHDAYVSFASQDIVAYDNASGCWILHFDGSEVGLAGSEINAFHIMADGSILISPYFAGTTLPNVGEVAITDIVRFIPTSLGKDTAGSFELYFKGAAVGLDKEEENINAIGILPDGRLVVSTSSGFEVAGVSGKDTDLIVFNATSLGEQTSGTWEMYFDGSKVGLGDGDVDINGVWIDSNSDIYLTTRDAFSTADITAESADIFKCKPDSTVTTSSCSYEFTWDGSDSGLPDGTVVNGIHLAL